MTTPSDPEILVVGEPDHPYLTDGLALLRSRGLPVAVIAPADEAGWRRALLTARAVVWRPWHGQDIPDDALLAAPRLRVLAGTFDLRVNPTALARAGIAVIDTSRSMTPSVAEFALLLTLNLLRDAPAGIECLRRGGWKVVSWPDKPGMVHGDLSGRAVGLAGFGSINRRYAEIVAGFGCRLAACDPAADDAQLARLGVRRVPSLVELARSSEILVIGIPPLANTIGIIDRAVIQALPKGAIVILVTRMAVVEQAALWERVQQGELQVGIDVYDPEPPPADAWFLRHPNVVATPHMAGGALFCHRRCFATACADALAVLDGGEPRYQVNARDVAIYHGR